MSGIPLAGLKRRAWPEAQSVQQPSDEMRWGEVAPRSKKIHLQSNAGDFDKGSRTS
jgi:hypothetical protein